MMCGTHAHGGGRGGLAGARCDIDRLHALLWTMAQPDVREGLGGEKLVLLWSDLTG